MVMPVNQDEGQESAWRTFQSVDRIPGNGKDGPVLQPNIHNCSTCTRAPQTNSVSSTGSISDNIIKTSMTITLLSSSLSGPIYKEKDKNNVLKDVRSGDTKR
jgi:hypothetical protein